MAIGIRKKIFLFTLIAIFLIDAVTLGFVLYFSRHLVLNISQNHLVRMSSLFKSVVETVKDRHTIRKMLEAQRGNTALAYQIFLVNEKGIIWGALNDIKVYGENIEDTVAHPEEGLRRVLRGLQPLSVEIMRHGEVEVTDASLPLNEDPLDRDRITGAIHLVEKTSTVESLNSLLSKTFLALFLISFITLFAGYLWIYDRHFLKPIDLLIKAIHRYTEGEAEVFPLPERYIPKGEIGSVITSQNRMVKRLNERTEEMLRIQRQALNAEKLASMGQLVAGVVHRINNPLDGIINCIQEMQKTPHDPGLIQEYLPLIRKELCQIERLMRDILCYSKPILVSSEIVDLGEIIEDVHLIWRSKLEGHRISFIKEGNWEVRLEGDYDSLKEAFMNIISNSIEALSAGGEIRAVVEQLNYSDVAIAFIDNGPGIAKENLKRVFDPFFTRKSGGTGLGLAIAKTNVQAHGGDIQIFSQPGEGTTVKLWLPLKGGAPGNGYGEGA